MSRRLLDAALRGGLKIDSSRRLEYLIRSSLAVLRYFRGEWTGLGDETGTPATRTRGRCRPIGGTRT
ncbi:hypothetical protein [Nonomuraea sp. NPDC052265]|uniref:hypothetical protein n=1 Tax=Nonomuraea sp. NPDC052265 TaxID=3364374 RepID=UPI0037C898AD